MDIFLLRVDRTGCGRVDRNRNSCGFETEKERGGCAAIGPSTTGEYCDSPSAAAVAAADAAADADTTDSDADADTAGTTADSDSATDATTGSNSATDTGTTA